MMLIASQVTAVVGGGRRAALARAGGLLGVPTTPVVVVRPPGDEWGDPLSLSTSLPVTQLEQKRFQPRCRT